MTSRRPLVIVAGEIQELPTSDLLGPDASAFCFRNKIIGGDFTTNPWQRGTSFTSPVSGTYTTDRFVWAVIGSGVVNILKTADTPTAAEARMYSVHCLDVDVTTADSSIAAGDLYLLVHRIEGLTAAAMGFGQAGTRNITLSFWHKHTVTGTYCVTFQNADNNRSYVAEYSQASADTWEKAIITIAVDTTGTWFYTTGIGLQLYFALAGGSTYQTAAGVWTAGLYVCSANQVNSMSSTSNHFKLALLQLEVGSNDTAFEQRPVGIELSLCQRYYYRNTPAAQNKSFGVASASGMTTADVLTDFPVTMRTVPTALEQNGTATDYSTYIAGAATACSAVPILWVNTVKQARTVFTVAAGLVAGQAGEGRTAAGTTAGYLGWSAEL